MYVHVLYSLSFPQSHYPTHSLSETQAGAVRLAQEQTEAAAQREQLAQQHSKELVARNVQQRKQQEAAI
jgi:hypothetical protein